MTPTVENLWANFASELRGFIRRDRPNDPLSDEVQPAVEPAADLPDLACCLRKFIDQLTPAHREALLLTEWEEVPQIALAKRLGLSASGAKSRVQRARAELKELLDACCRFELDRRGNIIEMTPREQECAGGCRPARKVTPAGRGK